MYVPAAVRKSSIARLLEVADMYPAFGSACRLPWPCWEYARAAVSLLTRSMMTIWALRLWVRLIPFHTIEVYEHRVRL